MKSMMTISFAFMALLSMFNSIFDGRVVAKLPFEPISLVRGLSHRGLLGEDYTDCSFLFLYILCTMSIRQVSKHDNSYFLIHFSSSIYLFIYYLNRTFKKFSVLYHHVQQANLEMVFSHHQQQNNCFFFSFFVFNFKKVSI